MNRNKRNWVAVLVLAGATLALGAAARPGMGALQPQPTGGLRFASPELRPVSFAGFLDRAAVLRGSDGLVRMQLVMRGEPRDDVAAERRPTDLIVVLDRSGSMNGNKMIHARAAIRELMLRLGPEDRFGLVTYSDYARFEIPLAPATKQAMRVWGHTVNAIGPAGATHMSAGLDLGLNRVLERTDTTRIPRVILISDGLANRGDSSVGGLTARARRAASGEFTLSAVGVGLDFNEATMTAIADAGTGNYYYLESAVDLSRVFAAEFNAARATVATALELRIEPAPGVRVLEAAGYPLEASANGMVIRPGALFAGQERRIWVTLAVEGDALGTQELGRFTLAYSDQHRRRELRFASTPLVTRVADRGQYFRSVDKRSYDRAVKQEGYGRLQQRVSEYVRRGEFAQANEAIDVFVDDHEGVNRRLRSDAIAETIDRARDLKASVGGAASSPEAQNAFGKKNSYEARGLRRQGGPK